jgi:hypothetical protein
MRISFKQITRLVNFGVMALVIAGCATTEQAPNVQMSGFLGDYTQFHRGKSGQAEYVYRDMNVDFGKYQKIILEPVQLWAAESSESVLNSLSKEDQQLLVDYLYVSLSDAFKRDYAIVNQPGPDVMKVRCAITEAKATSPVKEIISTVTPYGLGISYAKHFAVGMHTGVGIVSVEGEVLDSITGQRLAAVVDRRAGTKSFFAKYTRWGDVQDAFSFWARRVQTNLALLREHQV